MCPVRQKSATHRMAAALCGLFFLLAFLNPSAEAQARKRARATGTAPAAQTTKSQSASSQTFDLVEPLVLAGARRNGVFPSGDAAGLPSMMVHGSRPGPVIGYVFHGFASNDAFFAEMDAIFGKLDPKSMQGTVMAVSLPARQPCAPECSPASDSLWMKHADRLLERCRFLVEIHQREAGAPSITPHAFVYLPFENARLANYVQSMAKATLIRNTVELKADALNADNVEHLAARSIELEHPAFAIECAALSGNDNADTEQLRKGLINLLHHLKMAPGAVDWQNASTRVRLEDLPAGFFGGQP